MQSGYPMGMNSEQGTNIRENTMQSDQNRLYDDNRRNTQGSFNTVPGQLLTGMQGGTKDSRTIADYKPEVYFVGQIACGENFNAYEGLCCELIVNYGDTWELVSHPRAMQTHTAYTEPGTSHCW